MSIPQASSPSRAVVIGSGFGGLAAAVRLRALGYDVVVVEALDQPGGRARAFRDDGFVFDAGPTVITAPYLLEELFQLLGRDPADYYELMPVDPFYRVEFPDGSRFDYVGEEDRILAQIEQFDRRDVDGYRRMVRHMKEIFDVGYVGLADKPFGKFTDMLKVAPDMVRLQSYRTVYGLTSKYLHDEKLRQVFTFQPLLVGGNPFRTTSIYSMIHWLERKWGVWFAKGGTTALVHAFVRLLADVGVPVRCNSPVTRIDVDNGRTTGVVLDNGERIPCDIVVSNGDPSMVYTKLIDAKHRSRHTDASVARVKGSMGLFVAYFGTDSRAPGGTEATKFEHIKHHTIVLGPRYKGLLDDIFTRKVLADDFSLYLHRPTATDRSLAPAGHDAWYVLSPVPNLQGGQDWEKVAPVYLDKILKSLDRLAPGLSSSVTTMRHLDPRHFEKDYRTMHGAAFGPEPVLTQSAWFRYHNASPDVGGLYFVGAGTHPGAGVPGVISSAKVLERVVERPARPAAVPAARSATAAKRAAE
jgi:phytoene desaturase